MAYFKTIDERYNGGFSQYSAGTLDAPSTLNEVAVLADGSTGYGFLTDAYILGDIDIYSLGILDAGYYSVDVDGYTWDDTEAGYGSVSEFQVLNSYGGIVDTSYSTYSNIDFTVTSSSTYYVQIEGSSYSTEQYRVSYTKTRELVSSNTPAVFSNASYTGSITVGETITSSINYFDADGYSSVTQSAGLFTGWYTQDTSGFLEYLGGDFDDTITLSEDMVGKTLLFSKGFTDGLSNSEFSENYVVGVVKPANSPPTGSISITGTTKDGNTLTADTTNLDDADGLGTLSYQWTRNDVNINGAKSNFYELTQDDIGSQITVIVSYTDLMGAAEIFESNPTDVIYSSANSVLNGVEVSLTGDSIIDGLTNGYKWELDSSRVVDWTISSGFNGEYWISPQEVVNKVEIALGLFSYYADISFNYLGSFATPLDATANGSEINFSMDGSGLVFNNDAFWAIGFPPEPDDTHRGDIYLNINSQANYLSSYEIGSAGFFLILHELGHTLGLKHPHDDGGNARPTFTAFDLGGMDNDFMTVMSYEDGYDWNLINWDPGTPMFLDVLTLQYLYGKSETVFAGYSEHSLVKENLYATLWDPSGNDLIDQSAATEGWYIVMPDVEPSTEVDTKVGLAAPMDELSLETPLNLYWLMGDFENTNGSEFSDTIYGNSFENLIKGNGGDDILTGGSGSDTFIYAKGDGNDTILDFEHNEDSIYYQGFNAGEVAAFTESYLDDGSKVILLTDGAEITLNGNFSNPINNIPVLTIPATLTTDEDTTTAAIAFSGSDADGDTLTFSFSDPAKGSVVDNGNGTFTYTPNANANGSDSFTITANDGTVDVTETISVAIAAVNDDPTGSVTISGTASQGSELTAITGTLSDEDGLGEFNYQWLRDGADISDATSPAYTLVEADVGKNISVRVTYTDGYGAAETVTSLETSPVTNRNDSPMGAITISGTAVEDQTLSAVSTLSDPDGLGSLAYQWKADGADISGATAETFTVSQNEVGKAITVTVNYTDGGGTDESATSTATSLVTNVNDDPTGAITISGTVAEDQTLTLNSTVSDEDGIDAGTVSYQWYRDGSEISGASDTDYTLTQADVGTAITAKQSYSDDFGNDHSVTSTATSFVTNVNDDPTGSVTISGTAVEDQTLVAITDTLADEDGLGVLTYQWLRDGSDISGATLSTYTLMQDDIGSQVSIRASYTDGYGSNESVTSTSTASITEQNSSTDITLTGMVSSPDDLALQNIPITMFSEDLSANVITTTNEAGVFEFATAPLSATLVTADKSIDEASEDAIGAFDALQALRLAVGLTKSDGTAEWHDYLAADINKDGRVGADDALDILKFAVGLTDGAQADWVFVDGDADWSNVDRRNTDYNEGVMLEDVMVDTSINLTGILVGDLDGSYVA